VPQDLSQEVNLDLSHSDGLRMVDDDELDYAPDVMILPSKLKQFSKVGTISPMENNQLT
jgi:DNA polymerase alpha subunit B